MIWFALATSLPRLAHKASKSCIVHIANIANIANIAKETTHVNKTQKGREEGTDQNLMTLRKQIRQAEMKKDDKGNQIIHDRDLVRQMRKARNKHKKKKGQPQVETTCQHTEQHQLPTTTHVVRW